MQTGKIPQGLLGSVGRRLARCLACLAASAAVALGSATLAQASTAEVKRILADPEAFAAAVQAGGKTATFCFNCHGNAGHSAIPGTPNLAAQNPVYLLEQIRKFAVGERRDAFMQGLVKMLSEEDRLNIALYFSAQPAVLATSQPGPPPAAGQAVFRKVCLACHGEHGDGKDEIPRIAGQQPAYLVMALKAYRAKAGDRQDPRMATVAASLSDSEIAGLAAYLSTLK